MKILILGGNGYLGSAIIKELIKENHKVITTKRINSDLSRLEEVHSLIEFVGASLEEIENKFLTNTIEWVINLSCSYESKDTLYDSVLDSNIIFPLQVLNCATQHGIKNFLTIGTGLPDKFNMYSFSKKIYSQFGEFYSEKQNINFINIKLEMFFGLDEPENRFIPAVIQKMKKNEEVLLTEGKQRRDIIYLEDVCGAILHIVRAGVEGYRDVELGTGEAPTIRELVEYLHKHLHSNSTLRFGAIPMRKGEPDSIADISNLQELGYQLKYSWKEGILKIIQEVK